MSSASIAFSSSPGVKSGPVRKPPRSSRQSRELITAGGQNLLFEPKFAPARELRTNPPQPRTRCAALGELSFSERVYLWMPA